MRPAKFANAWHNILFQSSLTSLKLGYNRNSHQNHQFSPKRVFTHSTSKIESREIKIKTATIAGEIEMEQKYGEKDS